MGRNHLSTRRVLGCWQDEQRVVRQQGSGSVCSNVRLCRHVMAGCAAAESEQSESGVCKV